MPAHRIRLGPPWGRTAAGESTRHTRKFGRPRLQTATEQVLLVCASLPGPATVFVNGKRIGEAPAAGTFAADITHLLQPRNEVVIEAASRELPGDVALEIHTPLHISPAAPEDYEFTHDLTRANMEGYVVRHWGAWNPDIYRRNYDATENHVIRLGGERVGFFRLRPEGNVLILDDLQVRREFQGSGIGTEALAEVERLARGRGLKAVRLRCFHENPARRLYRRCGYAVVQTDAGADRMEKLV